MALHPLSSPPSAAHSPLLQAAPRSESEETRDAAALRAQSYAMPAGKPLHVAVFRNPRSHGNKGRVPDVAELKDDVGLAIKLVEPDSKAAIPAALAAIAASKPDLLVINGGDGTVRDVLTSGMAIFGDHWPPLAVLARGKTNALTLDLGVPQDWTVKDAIAAYRANGHQRRAPLVAQREGDKGGDHSFVAGFILGAGAFTMGTQAAQDAHRRGAIGGLAVGLTVLWSIAQILFGSARNKWRRGTPMRITLLPEERALTDGSIDGDHRRTILLATTLHQMPLGLRPFGKAREGLKLMVIDRPRRRLFLSAPLVVMGREAKWLNRLGLHQEATEGMLLDLDGEFILDGEEYGAGRWRVETGPELTFVTP